MRASLPVLLVAVLLVLGALSCGGGRRQEPRQGAPRVRTERSCEERLMCNAPVCSCPAGTRCEVRCEERRPGCTECVAP